MNLSVKVKFDCHQNKFPLLSGIYILAFLIMMFYAGDSFADNYLEVYGTRSGTSDTTGVATHFLRFGEQQAVFLPPYTAYFTVSPMGDSTFTAEIQFHELLPGLRSRNKTTTLTYDKWQSEDSLPGKDGLFCYSFRITKDTVKQYEYLPKDSLTGDESIHLRAWFVKESYADYKWQSRKGYIESVYDQFRKELKVTRTGKINCYVLPAGNYATGADIINGLGFDIPHGNLYMIFNDNFDSALPENIQRFVLYDTWGYSARSLVVGFARYYTDDMYQAKKIVANISQAKVISILKDEVPSNVIRADIISGAFVKYLIGRFSLGDFRLLYEKSSAGKLAVKEVFKQDLDDLVKSFINYEKKLRLNDISAIYFSEAFRSQLWFERALEYDTHLASGPQSLRFLKRFAGGLFYLGQYTESESCYARLAQFHKDDSELKYLAANAKLHAGKTTKALIELNEISGKVRNAAKMLAEYYLDQNMPDSAGRFLDNISDVSDVRAAILKARLALVKGDTGKADTFALVGAQTAENTISNIPGEGRGYIDVGNCQMLLGNIDAARGDFQIALFVENRPYYRGLALLGLGRLADIQSDRDSAISYYNQALKQNPGKYTTMLAKRYINQPFRLK